MFKKLPNKKITEENDPVEIFAEKLAEVLISYLEEEKELNNKQKHENSS